MKTDQIITYIIDWLQRYCRDAGLNGYVVGVSGGIDSAVTSTLCAGTGLPVRALMVPILQDRVQVTLAESHLKWLTGRYANVTPAVVDLSDVFTAFQQAAPETIEDGLTMANTRSRLRMAALYAYAGRYKLLVAGTGNKVEDFGVGFFTKYGDGGVDVSPIADLTKTEVWQLGRHLGILPDIISAPPTDGLWTDSRSDESQIGATYPELEWAMAFVAEQSDETGLTPRQQEVLDIYRRLNLSNRHKTEPIPVCRIPMRLKT